MTSLAVSPAQARAFRAFVIAALQTDEDGTVYSDYISAANVFWAGRNHPQFSGLHVVMHQIAFVPIAPAYSSHGLNADGDRIDITHRRPAEWTVSVQVVDPGTDTDPSLVGAAYLLRRLFVRVFMSSFVAPLRAAGLAPLRTTQISDLTRLARNVQWESVAALDLTFSAMPVIVETVAPIETVEGELSLSDVDGDELPVELSINLDD